MSERQESAGANPASTVRVELGGHGYQASWQISEGVLTVQVAKYLASAPLGSLAKHPETLARALAVQLILTHRTQIEPSTALRRKPSGLRLAARRILDAR